MVVVVTPIHCPSCGRKLTEAEEIRGQRLRCKGCKALLMIDLKGGVLTGVTGEKGATDGHDSGT